MAAASNVALSSFLIEELRRRFPRRYFVVGNAPDPLITFRFEHMQVGDLRVLEDGDEAIVEIGDITHGHFAHYDEAAGIEDRRKRVVNDVVEFLAALFEDRVLLWAHAENGSGGFEVLETPPDRMPPDRDVNWYVWSGPLQNKLGTERSGR